MWNTTNNTTNTSFNSPATGIIQKSNQHSYFLRMHQNSELSIEIFCEEPRHGKNKITVLQVLLTHESWFLVEIVQTSKL